MGPAARDREPGRVGAAIRGAGIERPRSRLFRPPLHLKGRTGSWRMAGAARPPDFVKRKPFARCNLLKYLDLETIGFHEKPPKTAKNLLLPPKSPPILRETPPLSWTPGLAPLRRPGVACQAGPLSPCSRQPQQRNQTPQWNPLSGRHREKRAPTSSRTARPPPSWRT